MLAKGASGVPSEHGRIEATPPVAAGGRPGRLRLPWGVFGHDRRGVSDDHHRELKLNGHDIDDVDDDDRDGIDDDDDGDRGVRVPLVWGHATQRQ